MVRLLELTAVISTTSSSAVSGSMTTVKVWPVLTVAPPSRVVAETTGMIVAPEVTEPVSVVCWDREVYLRVVIVYLSVSSGRGLGIGSSA